MYASWIPEGIVRRLRRFSRFFGGNPEEPAHLRTGRIGEEEACSYLRRRGYLIVERNWRTRGSRGEIDLIGWDGKILCFIEVKTRTRRALISAAAAVNRQKQKQLREVARIYISRIRPYPAWRFDVVSVYLLKDGKKEIDLFQDAFPRRSMSGRRRHW